MNIELTELKRMVKEAAELGVEKWEKRNAPARDELKQREVYRWVKTMGYGPSFIDELEKKGVIHVRKKGTAKNSSLLYSKAEIQAAIDSDRKEREKEKGRLYGFR